MMYRATFMNGVSRRFRAKHKAHAQKIAEGIARGNEWKLLSVGLV